MKPALTITYAPLSHNVGYTAVFNTLIALLLTTLGLGEGFGSNFVYAQCIGLLACSLTDGVRRLLWPQREPPLIALVPTMAAAIASAWLAGSWLAASLLGHPWRARDEMTSLLVTAAAGFAAVLYFWQREKVFRLEAAAAEEKSRTETIERQIAEARLKLLQAQIEPHFLFNTLANLHALIGVEPARAQAMLGHLNDFLRAALSAARKDKATLAEEFALLEGYLQLLAVRMPGRLKFRLDLPADLAQMQVPPMLLQPLVENAIKHGLEPKIEGGEVAIEAHREADHAVLQVADTGLGFAAAPTSGTRVGLAQVRERLAAVYGEAGRLEVAENVPCGVRVTVTLPLAFAPAA